MQVGNGKNQVGYGGGVSRAFNLYSSGNGLYGGFAVQILGFYAKVVIGEFPNIKAQADYHRKLGMNTGELPGDDRVKCADNGKLAAAFLGKIAKGKEFCFHRYRLPFTSIGLMTQVSKLSLEEGNGKR